MPDQDPLFDALRRFARVMSRHDVTDALYEICDQVTDVVGATGAGVALFDEKGDLRFVTATHEATVVAEQAQERTQSGRAWLPSSGADRCPFQQRHGAVGGRGHRRTRDRHPGPTLLNGPTPLTDSGSTLSGTVRVGE